MSEHNKIDTQAADFMLDTAHQLDYYIDRATALVKGVEMAATGIRERADSSTHDIGAAQVIAAYCGIMQCDLDDLSDLADRVGNYYPV